MTIRHRTPITMRLYAQRLRPTMCLCTLGNVDWRCTCTCHDEARAITDRAITVSVERYNRGD